jgi:DNA invertase Pin-like site-specific DNA recombinase
VTSRAAIYARFSSENQREASIDDQIRVCTAHLARDGFSVVETYADYAISGATTLRPGYQALLNDARARRFDIVVAESLDRFSRDQEHIAAFYKHMTFAGVSIVTLAEGAITELHIGLKGTMGALYLKDLAQKTHRGLEGRVRAGRSAGGLCYGYRVVRKLRPDGTTTAGMRVIDDTEAIVVRQIFADYAGGLSPRTIARALNQANVPGSRGGRWTASLILGNAVRETGILRNRLYAGKLVWNRQHFIKDPTSGKRVARPNPPSAWIVEPVPALRIIEPILWTAVQQRLEVSRRLIVDERRDKRAAGFAGMPGSTVGSRLGATRRPAWLLSGLVRCGLCGGGMTVVGEHGRLGCANHRERDTCTNRRTVLRDQILARVFVGLKDRLLAPELVETFVTEYVAEVNLTNRTATSRRSKLETELGRVDRQIRTMVQTIADTGGSRALVEELRALEHRQDQLREEIVAAGTPEVLPALHPNLAQVYRQKVERLEEALRDPFVSAAAVEALRSLIDAIVVHPGDQRGEVRVELRGDLAAFLHLQDENPASGPPSSGNGGSGRMMGSLVAGARNPLCRTSFRVGSLVAPTASGACV